MNRGLTLSLVVLAGCGAAPAEDTGLPIAALERSTQVDFAKEIVPFLKKNCFACHNEKKAKADLNLESPEAMMKGGDLGPALVPGKPMESLVFTFAAHLDEDPMPPAKNKAKAENLAPEELALLKLWIEQGAQGGSAAIPHAPTSWDSLANDPSIYAVALSPDGRFAACGRGNRIDVYDLRAGTLTATLVDEESSLATAHRDHVHALAFSRHGLLASGGYRTVKLWRHRIHDARSLPHSLLESPTAVATSPDGNWLAAGDGKGHLVVQDLAKPEKAPPQKHHGAAVRGVAFAKDNQAVYSLADDKTLARTSTADVKAGTTITLPVEGLALAVGGDGNTIAVGGTDGVIRLIPTSQFDPATGAEPAPPTERKGHSGKVIALAALGLEGVDLVSASEDGTARFWKTDGTEARQVNHGSPIVAFALHEPTGRMATAGQDGVVRIWSIADGNKLGELAGNPDFDTVLAGRKRTRDLAVRVADLRKKQLGEREKNWNTAKEKSKAEAGKIAAALKDLEAKEAIAIARRKEAESASRDVAALERAEDKSPLGKAKERAKKAGEELAKAEDELTKAERAAQGATRNRDLALQDATNAGERFLAAQAASSEADAALATAEEAVKAVEAKAPEAGPGAIASLAFSPDGSVLAVGAEKIGLRLWSATTFQALDVLREKPAATGIRFRPDGQLLASFGDRTIASWESAAAWEKVRQIGDGKAPDPFPGRVLALAFHPRGHLLATGSGIPSRLGQVRFWRVRDGYAEGTIEKAHVDTVTGVAFSPDGARIASSSTDRFVKIHEVSSGRILHQLEGPAAHVLDVAWSADGQTLASVGADHQVRLWDPEEGRQRKAEGGFKKEVTALAFIGTGDSFVTGSADRIVKAAGQNLPGIEGVIYAVAASADGALIAAGGERGVLRIWRAGDRKLLHSFPPPAKSPTETAAR